MGQILKVIRLRIIFVSAHCVPDTVLSTSHMCVGWCPSLKK